MISRPSLLYKIGIRGPHRYSAFAIAAALLALTAGAAFAQAPVVIGTYPRDGAMRVPVNAVFVLAFDRPTAKHAAYSVADFTAGGGLLNTAPDRWSPLGDTLYITPFTPLQFGHEYGMKLNRLQAADSTFYGNPAYYQEIYYFSTAYPASVERVQAGNLNLSLTPDVTLPVPIPVRELAGTDVQFTSARVQFLSSSVVADSTQPLDLAVSPIYEYTVPIGIFLRRNGATSLVAPVTLPGAVARTIPQGVLGVRLTFYGTDETSSSVLVDAVFRVDPATIAVHQGSVLPAIASDVLVRTAVLEWPLHGAVIAAGDTILPRAVVTGNGTGAFRAAFYMDGDLISIEEGYMEAGRPVEVTMRGPLPTRRLGEHRLQFAVESPQPLAANPISFICAPPPNGVAPLKRGLFEPPPPPPRAMPEKLHGWLTWLAEGRSKFREEEDHSAVGWGAWNGAYELGPTRTIEAEASMRLRFDELGNGRAMPQHVKIRYSDPRRSLEYGDAPPDRAYETPLLMSPVPRRGAQANWRGSPLGDLDGYVALSSNPVSAAGGIRNQGSDLYSARLKRSLLRNRVEATLYGGYTHEKGGPELNAFGAPADSTVRRAAIYGAMAKFDLPGTWTLLADGATVRHRAAPGVEPGRSRTGWRSELRGTAAGFDALAQGFSYQPALATALNPYALSDRRGGYAKLEHSLWHWRFFGSFRSEEPAHTEGLEPVVRVQTGTFGGRLAMNQDSWVTPSFVHVRNKGANTDFTENRIATEYSASEPLGGRTTARFDVAFIDDELRAATKRRVTSGSLVTTRRHPGRMVSTIALGFEENKSSGLNRTDTTIQGSFEVRWEPIAGRFLVIPLLTGSSRHYDLLGTKEERYSTRLQLVLLRVAGLGENAVSLEGRADRVQHLTPSRPKDLDTSVLLTIGQRFGIGGL